MHLIYSAFRALFKDQIPSISKTLSIEWVLKPGSIPKNYQLADNKSGTNELKMVAFSVFAFSPSLCPIIRLNLAPIFSPLKEAQFNTDPFFLPIGDYYEIQRRLILMRLRTKRVVSNLWKLKRKFSSFTFAQCLRSFIMLQGVTAFNVLLIV